MPGTPPVIGCEGNEALAAGGTVKFSVIGSEILRGILRVFALTRGRVTSDSGGSSW